MSTSTPGRSPNVPREERIELYNKLADTLDQAKEIAMALKLPQWRKRINQYTRQAFAARDERDQLLDVIARLEQAAQAPITHPRKSRPDTPAENKRRERDAARKRQERRARSERTADAMMLPGGVNSLAWQLLYGDPSERSED